MIWALRRTRSDIEGPFDMSGGSGWNLGCQGLLPTIQQTHRDRLSWECKIGISGTRKHHLGLKRRDRVRIYPCWGTNLAGLHKYWASIRASASSNRSENRRQ